MKTKSHEEVLDQFIGKKGTHKREKFEKKLKKDIDLHDPEFVKMIHPAGKM